MNRSMAIVLGAGVGVISLSLAGPLDPPAGPVAPTYKTLFEVQPRTAIGPLTTPGDATAMVVISAPGSYYLQGGLTNSGAKHGIRIDSDGVTLDLNGFTLSGDRGTLPGVSLSGIYVSPGLRRTVIIRNGNVVNWVVNGVDASVVNNAVLEDLTVTDCGGTGIAGGEQSRIESCISMRNSIGIASGGSITACITSANRGDGILGGAATVLACMIRENEHDGIDSGSDSRIERCYIDANLLCGVRLAPQSLPPTFQGIVEHNHIVGNHRDGVLIQSGCIVRENMIAKSGLEFPPQEAYASVRALGTRNCIESNNFGEMSGVAGVICGGGNLVVKNHLNGGGHYNAGGAVGEVWGYSMFPSFVITNILNNEFANIIDD